MASFDPGTLLAGALFGAVGFAAFVYGKKESSWKPMLVGIGLMAFPYFVPGLVPQLAVGTVLVLLLFFPRE